MTTTITTTMATTTITTTVNITTTMDTTTNAIKKFRMQKYNKINTKLKTIY